MTLTDVIPLPYRLAIVAGLFAAAFGFGWVKGAGHVQAAWTTADALRVKQDDSHLAADNARAQADTDKLRAVFDAAAELRYKENTQHEHDLEAVRARAAAGVERLRCPASALPADAQAAHPGPAAGPGAEDRPGEIVPAAAADLFRIGAGVAGVVRDRNALIDLYNQAQATCNAK